MVGASKAYNKGKFTKEAPLQYFLRESDKWCMEVKSKEHLRRLLEEYANV
jgi:hypothetical protein